MMPADAELPCVTNPHVFDAVLTISPDTHRDGAHSRNLVAAAKAVCGTCAHTVVCLRENADAEGVVAGLTEQERHRLGSRASCGKPAGYRLHRYHGEPSCQACREAFNDDRRDRRVQGGAS